MKIKHLLIVFLALVVIILGWSLGKTIIKGLQATPEPLALPIETVFPTETLITTLIEDVPDDSTSWLTPNPYASEVSMWSSSSPNGELVARGIFSTPKSGEQAGQTYASVTVGKPNGNIYWTLFDGWLVGGLGSTTPQPVQWSLDSKYFYYTDQPEPAVDGCKVLQANGVDLKILDVNTGEIVELLPEIAFSIALSPDESRVAFIQQGSFNLVIRDLSFGQDEVVDIDPGWDFEAGNLFWSPDGNALALTIANLPCSGGYPEAGLFAESTSILVVDTSNYQVRNILDEDTTRKVTIGWESERSIKLQDPTGNVYILDEITGTLISGYCTQLLLAYQPMQGYTTYCDPYFELAFDYPHKWSLSPISGTQHIPASLAEDMLSVISINDTSDRNTIEFIVYTLSYGKKLEELFESHCENNLSEQGGLVCARATIGDQPAYALLNSSIEGVIMVDILFQRGETIIFLELKRKTLTGMESLWQVARTIQMPETTPSDNIFPEELVEDSLNLIP